MNKVKYSIIVPVYDNQDGLTKIVESFLSMGYLGNLVELIIVDDGSKVPVTVESKPGVKLIRQPNSGVSGARNNGIRNAKGDYVAFLDSDDSYHSCVIDIWESLTQEEFVDAFIFPYVTKDEIKNKTTFHRHKCDEASYSGIEALKLYYDKQVFTHICGILCKRTFLFENELFFNQKLALSEDVFFTAEVLRKAEYVRIDNSQYYDYIIQQGSATNVVATEKVLNHFEAFDVISQSAVPHDVVRYRNYFVATMYINYLIKLIRNKCSSELVISETVSKKHFLQKSFSSSFSVRYLATLAFKAVSFLPSSFLRLMLNKLCKIKK